MAIKPTRTGNAAMLPMSVLLRMGPVLLAA
jgi:hypothetical protein